MIPLPPEPQYPAGTKVLVTQHVRVGHLKWVTRVVGTIEDEGVRPVGGMEMGDKALYCRQDTLLLRRETGELTSIALDTNTQVEVIDESTSTV